MSGTLRSMAAAPQPVSGHVNVMAHARSSMILPSTRALHAADSTMSLPMHSAAAARGYPQIGPQMASAMTAPQEMLVIPTESFAEDFLTCVTCQVPYFISSYSMYSVRVRYLISFVVLFNFLQYLHRDTLIIVPKIVLFKVQFISYMLIDTTRHVSGALRRRHPPAEAAALHAHCLQELHREHHSHLRPGALLVYLIY